MKRFTLFVSLLVVFSVILSACTPAATEAPPVATEAPATDAPATEPPATEAPAIPLVLKYASVANITT
ncbi:MAG: hypothetical protein L0287_35295, partial [Anaerolineae bacterium]|nr:hypothetical protein [Anaerolineae bacterium]